MGTKEYHAQKSRECYERKKTSNPEWVKLRSAYSAKRRQDKKSAAVKHFGGKCFRCFGVFPDCVFEFHHRDPSEKDITPAGLFLLSNKKIYAELSKCDMLCANCHRVTHYEDGYSAHKRKYD
jgi:hypothetical protein